VMSDEPSKQRPVEPPKRGEAAWRAHRNEIATRNERASRLARARREEGYAQLLARRREDELRERAELARRPR
jgi:hypothetical protein